MAIKSFFTILLFSYIFLTPSPVHALNRLGIRNATDGTGGEFYDTVTNRSVLLRGNNYQRLIRNPTSHHSIFIPGEYDHARYSAAMIKMKQDGYNAIRVFLSEQDLPLAKDQKELSPAYIENVLKFVKLANENNMYIFVQIAILPWGNSYYLPAIPTTDPHFQTKADYNRLILHGPTVDAKKTFVKEIVTALKNQGIALGITLDNIVGYSVINEPYFNTSAVVGQAEQPSKPLSLNSGIVTTGNGKQYNMAIASDKIKMLDENLVYYTNAVRQSIKEVDPQALVGMSLFSPLTGTLPGRTTRTASVINNSEADFISIHFYPLGSAANFEADFASLGRTNKSKPLIMGEYGAWKQFYPNSLSAANDLKTVQVKSCSLFNFRGWFAYEWDTTGAEYAQSQDLFHHPTDPILRQALAPIYRSNPCKSENVPLPSAPDNPSPMPGDFNTDGFVNLLDFNFLISKYGNPFTISDLNLLLSNLKY